VVIAIQPKQRLNSSSVMIDVVSTTAVQLCMLSDRVFEMFWLSYWKSWASHQYTIFKL